MSNTIGIPHPIHLSSKKHKTNLAAAITKASSKQTYYTIRFLVDKPLIPDAYRAYAYFRWVDDCLDAETGSRSERIAFVNRQQSLLETFYRRESAGIVSPEEQMLVELVKNDTEKTSGLQSYLRNMMAVMVFDVGRRGRLISQAELLEYSRLLATAVTDALHYFIGHNCPSPCSETRYLAVQGAHVVHMLRDTVEDTAAGYINIASEYIESHGISLQEIDSPAYRKWVYNRVQQAGLYFRAGEHYLTQVKSLRCRLAGFAYIARFKWMLRAIQRDEYCLRAAYPERKTLQAGLWMVGTTISSILFWHKSALEPGKLTVQQAQYKKL